MINIVWTIYYEVICFPWVVQSDTSKVLNFPVLSFTPSSSSLNCQTEHFGHFWRLALFCNAKILAAPSSQSQSVSDVEDSFSGVLDKIKGFNNTNNRPCPLHKGPKVDGVKK